MADIQKKLQGDIDKYEALQKGWDICLSYYENNQVKCIRGHYNAYK